MRTIALLILLTGLVSADEAKTPADFNDMLRLLNVELNQIVQYVDRTIVYLEETQDDKLTKKDLDENLKTKAKVHFEVVFARISEILSYEDVLLAQIEKHIHKFQRDAAYAEDEAEKKDILSDIATLEKRKADYRSRFRTLEEELKLLETDIPWVLDSTYYDRTIRIYASNLVSMEDIIQRLQNARKKYDSQLDLANSILCGKSGKEGGNAEGAE